jgi:hypothetical protein
VGLPCRRWLFSRTFHFHVRISWLFPSLIQTDPQEEERAVLKSNNVMVSCYSKCQTENIIFILCPICLSLNCLLSCRIELVNRFLTCCLSYVGFSSVRLNNKIYVPDPCRVPVSFQMRKLCRISLYPRITYSSPGPQGSGTCRQTTCKLIYTYLKTLVITSLTQLNSIYYLILHTNILL